MNSNDVLVLAYVEGIRDGRFQRVTCTPGPLEPGRQATAVFGVREAHTVSPDGPGPRAAAAPPCLQTVCVMLCFLN